MSFQIPRGLFDILPFGTDKKYMTDLWQFVESISKKTARDYFFKEVRTPIFEKTELFYRTSGKTSDIVKKEMYTFYDRSNRSMTLRPEGTAPFIRSFVENNLSQHNIPLKFYYISPMFRYDRPQKGRYRQHHQFGTESIGQGSFYRDAEIIDLLMEFYKRIGLKNLTLHINSVGDTESREAYKKKLKLFLKDHFPHLSSESKKRFSQNPLRILDSKNLQDKKILKDAPSILNSLNATSKKYFESLCSLLKKQNIDFTVDKNLVRGLDYYTHTVFEVTSDKLGAQNSIGGGGRYDDLIKDLKGPDLIGVGFGTGIERIIQTMLEQNISIPSKGIDFVIIPLCERAKDKAFDLATKLRHLKIQTEILIQTKKIQKALQKANNINAKYCIIIGEEELEEKKYVIKDMEKRTQKKIDAIKIISFIKNKEKNGLQENS